MELRVKVVNPEDKEQKFVYAMRLPQENKVEAISQAFLGASILKEAGFTEDSVMELTLSMAVIDPSGTEYIKEVVTTKPVRELFSKDVLSRLIERLGKFSLAYSKTVDTSVNPPKVTFTHYSVTLYED